MIKEYDNFIIEYTSKDEKYIDELINRIIKKEKEIFDFFKLESLKTKVKIKLWNSIEEYRNYRNAQLKNQNRTVQEWEVGNASTYDMDYQINILSYEELVKAKGHTNDDINALIKIGIHEFAHICFADCRNNNKTLLWINEGMATFFAEQYDKDSVKIDAPLDKILDDEVVNYYNYYALFTYLIKNYDKDFILQLASNQNALRKLTPIIYEEAKRFYEIEQANLIK